MCEHLWVSKEEIDMISPENCKGEVGPTEMLLTPTIVDPKEASAVCFRCYEIAGSGGKKHPGLIKFEAIMNSFS